MRVDCSRMSQRSKTAEGRKAIGKQPTPLDKLVCQHRRTLLLLFSKQRPTLVEFGQKNLGIEVVVVGESQP